MKKRFIALGLAAVAAVIIILTGRYLDRKTTCRVFASDGTEIGTIGYDNGALNYSSVDGCDGYMKIVAEEAYQLTSGKDKDGKGVSSSDNKVLITDCAEIYTELDLRTQEQAKKTVKETAEGQKDAAISVSTPEGALVASYSEDMAGKEADFQMMPTYAASAIKPLSVYGPALEMGLIDPESSFLDAPVKKVKMTDGRIADWPSNTRPYSGEMISAKDALAYSNNAVAVRVLGEVGVSRACHFLTDSFGFDTTLEQKKIETEGEDAVLGNVALGVLDAGITQLQLLGAYAAIAGDGSYLPVHAICRIKNQGGFFWYEYNSENDRKQVFSSRTLEQLREMLRAVVDYGTGKAAGISGREVFGKTGTSDGLADNWFIGWCGKTVLSVWYKENDPVAETHDLSLQMFKRLAVALTGSAEQLPETETDR